MLGYKAGVSPPNITYFPPVISEQSFKLSFAKIEPKFCTFIVIAVEATKSESQSTCGPNKTCK